MGRRKHSGAGVSFFAFQDIITSVVGIFVLITLIMVVELAQTVSDTGGSTSGNISREILETLATLEKEVSDLQAQFDNQTAAHAKSAGTNRFNRDDQLKAAKAKLAETELSLAKSIEIAQESRQSLKEAKKSEQALAAESRAVQTDRQRIDELQTTRKKIQRYSSVLEVEKPVIFRDQTAQSRYVVLIRLEDAKITISDALEKQEKTFLGSDRVKAFENWLMRVELGKRQIFVVLKSNSVQDFEDIRRLLDNSSANWGFDISALDQNFRLRYELEKTP